jgi:outer membrane protein TolC
MKFRLLSVFLILCFFATFLSAQEAEQPLQLLKLGDAISIALEKSYEMKVVRLDRLSAEKNLAYRKGNFKMRMDASFNVPNTSQGVQEISREGQLPVYESRGSTNYLANLSITQPLPTDGWLRLEGETYYNRQSYWDYGAQQMLKRNDVLTSTSLRLNQPLFTLNELKTELKRADLNYESAVQRYKREELDIVYNVTQSFFDLYNATRELEIAVEDEKKQQEVAQLAKQKYEAGLIAEVEALQAEVYYTTSRNERVAAEAAINRFADAFKQLIGLTFKENVGVMTTFDYNNVEVDTDLALEMALDNRSEIRLNEVAVELSNLTVKQRDAMRAFNGSLSAFYDITGVANSDVWNTSEPRPLWEQSLKDMDDRPDNRGVVFTLNVPIWDSGANKAFVQSAEADKRAAELALVEIKKTIERQVRSAISSLDEAQNQLEVLDKQEDISKRAYDISLERFNNGDISSQELENDRKSYIEAQRAYLRAYIGYQLALADLKRTTMYDFENGHSLVE